MFCYLDDIIIASNSLEEHIEHLRQTSGRWQPLVFYSKKLSGSGTRYSTFDRELLAAFSTVRHFRFLLEGRQFRLLTDHKPLVTSLSHPAPRRRGRPNSSGNSPSSPNSHQTSDTHQARRTW